MESRLVCWRYTAASSGTVSVAKWAGWAIGFEIPRTEKSFPEYK
jgi:hypothetical protein